MGFGSGEVRQLCLGSGVKEERFDRGSGEETGSDVDVSCGRRGSDGGISQKRREENSGERIGENRSPAKKKIWVLFPGREEKSGVVG